MNLPVRPPLPPMLARLERALPGEGFVYEPKWDGFRCLAFRDGLDIDLRSRHDRPLARYFPELVERWAPSVTRGSSSTVRSSRSPPTSPR